MENKGPDETFEDAHDDLNLHMLRLFEDTFSLDVA